MIIRKCGCCGEVLHKIESGNDKHILLTVNPTTATISTTGMPVDAYGCVKCGSITLFDDTIVGQRPKF